MKKFTEVNRGFTGRLLAGVVVVSSLIVSGCGVAQTQSAPAAKPPAGVSVSLASNTTQTVGEGQPVSITATIANDAGAKGVTWLLTGAGSLQTTDTTATYTAPAVVKTGMIVTILATSVADVTKSANIKLKINGIVTVANACTGEATGNESLLAAESNYAFFFQGIHGSGVGSPVEIAGSIATDGAGNLTGGEEDINTPSGPQHLAIDPTASVYTVGPDNRGCMVLTLVGGSPATEVFHFALAGVTAGVASKGRLIEFDDASETSAGTRGSGIIRLQDPASFSLSSLQARYSFGMDGVDSVGGHVAMGGAFSVNTAGSITNGFMDVNDAGALQTGITGATGTISATATTASTGRETASLAWSSGSQSQNDAIYMVNANEFFIIQIDQLDGIKPITLGRAIVTGSTFSNASLSGNYIFHAAGSLAGSGNVGIGVMTLSSGTMNGSIKNYTAAGGLVDTPVSGASYTVDASNSGRVSLVGLTATPPVLYIATPAANTETISTFIVGTTSSAQFGLVEFQPTVTYSASSLSGDFMMGTQDPYDNTSTAFVGSANVTNTPTPGMFSAVEDINDSSGVLQFDLPDSELMFINADGTGGFVGNTVFFVTNGTKLFWLQAEPGAPAFLVIIEQ